MIAAVATAGFGGVKPDQASGSRGGRIPDNAEDLAGNPGR